MEKESEIGINSQKQLEKVVEDIDQLIGQELKEQLIILFSLITAATEGNKIEGSDIILNKIVKLFCVQSNAEIQGLCLSILQTLNMKSDNHVNVANIEIFCITLIHTIQSSDKVMCESAKVALIDAMIKITEIKQYLVYCSQFIQKAITALSPQEFNSSLLSSSTSQSIQQYLSNTVEDYTKHAFLDILIWLGSDLSLKWKLNEVDQLIEVLQQNIQQEQEDEENPLKCKISELIPILRQVIERDETAYVDINFDESEKLQKDIQMKDDKIDINQQQLQVKEDQIALLTKQICILQQLNQQQQQQSLLNCTTFICGLCGETNRILGKCEKCLKERCKNCLSACHQCHGSNCKNCLMICELCENSYCQLCFTKGLKCSGCEKSICELCIKECEACSKQWCPNCVSTGQRCGKCKKMTCTSCSEQCERCKQPHCSECFAKLMKCKGCEKSICAICLRFCARCEQKCCADCVNSKAKCTECGQLMCMICITQCWKCKKLICTGCQIICMRCQKPLCEACTVVGKKRNWCKGGCE